MEDCMEESPVHQIQFREIHCAWFGLSSFVTILTIVLIYMFHGRFPSSKRVPFIYLLLHTKLMLDCYKVAGMFIDIHSLI